jgi:hypothetical protein
MGREVLVCKSDEGIALRWVDESTTNGLSMRDFGGDAGNGKVIGCEKIKWRPGDSAAAGTHKRRAAAHRGQT